MQLWEYNITGYGTDVGMFKHKGIIYGENFTEAVDNLENYYMNEIETLYIEPVGEEGNPFVFNEQYKINEEE